MLLVGSLVDLRSRLGTMSTVKNQSRWGEQARTLQSVSFKVGAGESH